MKEAPHSSVLTRTTLRNIPEDGILHFPSVSCISACVTACVLSRIKRKIKEQKKNNDFVSGTLWNKEMFHNQCSSSVFQAHLEEGLKVQWRALVSTVVNSRVNEELDIYWVVEQFLDLQGKKTLNIFI
jgi:hypothetical protein